jgi:2-dehydropantoate 2-reductase
MPKPFRISIVGAGSVGSFLTYVLNRSSVWPIHVFRNPPFPKYQYIVMGDGKRIPLDYGGTIYDNTDRWSYSDVIIIATKAYDAEEILEDLASMKRREWKLLVLVQNGLGVFEKAVELFGPGSVAQLVLNHGIHRVGPGTYRWVGGGRSYIGMMGGHSNDALNRLAGLMAEASIEVVRDIQPYRWLKLSVNAVINPVSAILRRRNRVVAENSYVRDNLARSIISETTRISESLGIKLPADPYEETMRVARETGNNYSSMYMDLKGCRRTEIDYINGAIASHGKRLGIDTPYNEALYYIVKALESRCAEKKYSVDR